MKFTYVIVSYENIKVNIFIQNKFTRKFTRTNYDTHHKKAYIM